ncbi:cytochrome P450 [Novosphingobium pentaromativorans US6-1]|nr:cytochrome P450 [Novosphingobium pentaromativorans US6-1]
MDVTAIKAQDYDPFSPEVMRNPLPYYAELRRSDSIFYSAKYDAFFLSRFSDILELLGYTDNTFIASEGTLPVPAALAVHNAGAPALPPTNPFPLSQRLGMPIHGEVRRAHMKPLLPRSVTELRDFVSKRANERLDELIAQRHFDLTREFGGIVSGNVIARLLGMPLELGETVLDLVNAGSLADPVTGGVDTRAAAQKVIALILPWVERRFEAGADGSYPLIDGMIGYRFENEALTPEQVAQQIACAVIGGVETVPKVVAHGLMELNARPEQMAAVRADLKAAVPKLAEEMIRFCAPAQWFMRTAHKPVTIAGQRIEPGQRVFYIAASAARDEREFDEPDEFRWDRPIRRTLAFGHGMHFCIGTHLARMEVQVLVETFLSRVHRFHFDLEESVRLPSSFQWGWNSLSVSIEEAE